MKTPVILERLYAIILILLLALLFRLFSLDCHERVLREMGSLLLRTNTTTPESEPELVFVFKRGDDDEYEYEYYNDEGYYD